MIFTLGGVVVLKVLIFGLLVDFALPNHNL